MVLLMGIPSNEIMALVLGLAAGVMLTVSVFDMWLPAVQACSVLMGPQTDTYTELSPNERCRSVGLRCSNSKCGLCDRLVHLPPSGSCYPRGQKNSSACNSTRVLCRLSFYLLHSLLQSYSTGGMEEGEDFKGPESSKEALNPRTSLRIIHR